MALKTKKLSVLILAAGQGTRMKSRWPKVLHPVAGQALLHHVVSSAKGLKPTAVSVIIGHQGQEVQAALGSWDSKISVFWQKRQRGSGDAVRQAASWLKRQGGEVLILCGDTPLLRTETLKSLLVAQRQGGHAVTVLTGAVSDPTGYGRIVRTSDGSLLDRIVEERDASPGIREIREINTGVYCFDVRALLSALPKLRADNAKGEYYLTDVIEILKAAGLSAGACLCSDPEEALGVNRRRDLAQAEKVMRRRIIERWMDEGVTFVDPDSTYVQAGVKIGSDTVIQPGTHLLGQSVLGSGCRVGPFAYLQDCFLADNVQFVASFARQARVGEGVRVGPFSHLREGTVIASGAHVGNFSEIKKSRIGKGSKINHLSYIGDATVGDGVNIGAGTITCNYDGWQKFRTVIGAGSFIGSNVNLVAPVSVGSGSVVGAGSTITKSVPAGALALERAPQVIKKGWAKKRRAEKENH